MSDLHSDKPRNPNAGLFSTIINDANNDTNRVTDSDANTHALASLKAHDKLSSDSRPPVVSDKSKANSPMGAFTESFTSSIHNMGFASVQVVREVTGNKELLKDFKPAPVSHEANIGTGNWLAQQLGSGVAFAIPMAATAWLTRGRSVGVESSTAFSGMKAAAASGAITGFAFTPTLDNKGEAATGGAFWQKKALQTGSMSAAFATMAGVDKMHIGGHIGKAILPGSTAGIAAIGGRIAQRGLDGAIAGYSGGLVDTSIQSGFKADLGTLNESAVKWAAAGALFSGAGEGLKRSNFTGAKGNLGVSPELLAIKNSVAPAGQKGASSSVGEGHIVASRGPGRQPPFRQDAPTPSTGRGMGTNVGKGERGVSERGTEATGKRKKGNSSEPPAWLAQNKVGKDGTSRPTAEQSVEAARSAAGGAKGSGGFGSEKAGTRSNTKVAAAAEKPGLAEVTKPAPVAVPPVERPVLNPVPGANVPEAKGAAIVRAGEPQTAVTGPEAKGAAMVRAGEPQTVVTGPEAKGAAIVKAGEPETAIIRPETRAMREPRALTGVSNVNKGGELSAANAPIERNAGQNLAAPDSKAIAPAPGRPALPEAMTVVTDVAPQVKVTTGRDALPNAVSTGVEPTVGTEPRALTGVRNVGELPAPQVDVPVLNPAPVRKPSSANTETAIVSDGVTAKGIAATPKELTAGQNLPVTDGQAVIPQAPARPALPSESGAKQNVGLEALRTQPPGKAAESTMHVAEVVEVTTPTQSRLASAEPTGVIKASDRPVSAMTVDVSATPVGAKIVERTIEKQVSGNPEMPSLSGSAISLERPYNPLEGSVVSPKQVGTQLRQTAIASVAAGRQVIHQAGEAFNAAKVNITDTVSRGKEAVSAEAGTRTAGLIEGALPIWRKESLNLAQAGRNILDSTGKTVETVTTFKASEIKTLPGTLEARKGNWDAKALEIAEAARARILGVREGTSTFTSDWKQRARDTRANLAGVEASVKEGGSSAMTKWEGKVNRGLLVDEGVRKLLEVPEGAVWSRKVEAGKTRDEVARNYLIEKGTEATNFTSDAVRFLSLQDIKLRRTLGNAVNSALDGAETFVAGGPERHTRATGRLVDIVKTGAERDAEARAKVANWFGEKLGNLRRGITDGTNQDAQSRKQLEITADKLQAENGARPVSAEVSRQVTKIRETVAPVVTERATQLQNGLMAGIERARQAWIDYKNPKTTVSATGTTEVLALAPSEAASLPVSMAHGSPKELAFMTTGKPAKDLSNPITALRNDQRTVGAIKEQLLPEAKSPSVPE